MSKRGLWPRPQGGKGGRAADYHANALGDPWFPCRHTGVRFARESPASRRAFALLRKPAIAFLWDTHYSRCPISKWTYWPRLALGLFIRRLRSARRR
jgi:hypothetical protein